MRDFSSKSWFVLALVLCFTAAAPVHAQISVDLAKKCAYDQGASH